MSTRPALVVLILPLLATLWLALVAGVVAPAGAQTVFSGCVTTTPVGGQSLYVGCVTLTPSATHSPTYTATASLPPTLTPRPTMTTVRLASPTITLTPFPTHLYNVTQVDPRLPLTQTAAIYGEATRHSELMTQEVGYNAQTAVAATLYAYYAMMPTATPDEVTPMPTLSPTPIGSRYQVVAAAGMNVRSQPTTGSSTIGYLRYGDIVYIGEHRRVGNIVWGAVLGPNIQWVAIVYDTTPNRSGDETIYLRGVGTGS